MSAPVEREAKLVLPPGAELPPLEVAGTDATPAEDVELHTTYWDTPGRVLAASGRSLRYRHGVKWTAKRAGQASALVLDRPERHFDGGGDAPPSEAVEFLEASEHAGDLAPVVVLETTRKRRNVCAEGSGAVLVEVVDDDVSVFAPGGAPAGGFREIELEVKHPDGERVLRDLLDRIAAAGIQAGQAMPKYERALGLLAPGG